MNSFLSAFQPLYILKRFLTALSYVTWLPLEKTSSDSSPGEFGSAEFESDLAGLAKYLPSVGLLIGAFLLGLALACALLFKASFILTSAILVVAWLWVTGGLHFDGLMDTADGVFSHRSKERMLEIMHDPRAGNFAILTGVSVLLLKVAALSSLCQNLNWLLPALILTPAWSRWCELYAIAIFPYAREEGKGKIWHDTTDGASLLLGAIVPVVVTVLIGVYYGWIATGSVVVFACTAGIAVSHWLSRQIGGHTGDTYGAVVEIAEVACLVSIALIAGQGNQF